MNHRKEVAKFFAGAAAWEAVAHVIWIVVVAAISILLAWYAWGRSEGGEPEVRAGENRQAQEVNV